MTDYLDKNQLSAFLYLIYLKTHLGARVIFRRLNGDLELHPYVNRYFMILEIDRDFRDRSGLYREVVVATPRPEVFLQNLIC